MGGTMSSGSVEGSSSSGIGAQRELEIRDPSFPIPAPEEESIGMWGIPKSEINKYFDLVLNPKTTLDELLKSSALMKEKLKEIDPVFKEIDSELQKILGEMKDLAGSNVNKDSEEYKNQVNDLTRKRNELFNKSNQHAVSKYLEFKNKAKSSNIQKPTSPASSSSVPNGETL